MSFPRPFAAILLAGGRSRRLGGIDKTALVVDGRSLLQHAADSVAGSELTVVVGPPGAARLPAGTLRVREDPPFCGPAAGLLAGVEALRRAGMPAGLSVVVLACDLVAPAAALTALGSHLPHAAEGMVAVDDAGNRQPLLGVYRLDALCRLAQAPAAAADRSLRSLLAPLRVAEVAVPTRLCADIDTAADAREHHLVLPATPQTPLERVL